MTKNQSVRKYRICTTLNDKELKVFEKFCKKYKIDNRAKFIRETLMKAIIEIMVEQDYPKLFPEIDNHQKQNLFQQQTDDTDNPKYPLETNTDYNHPKLFDQEAEKQN